MGSPAYFGKLVNFTAAMRKPGLIPFGTFSPNDNLNFIASMPGPAIPAVAPYIVTFASPLVIDTSLSSTYAVTLTGNVASMTLNYQGGPTIPDGTMISIRISQDATGGWTCALPTNLVTDFGYAIDPGALRTTVLPIQWNNGNSKWIFSDTAFSVTGQ